MKFLSIFLVFVFLLSSTVSAQEKKNPIEGAWQLLEGKFVSADTTYNYPATPSEKGMKIIGNTHFATVFQDTANAIADFNGGTYTLDNDIYTEYLSFSSQLNDFGSKAIFKVKIEKDRLFLTPSTVDGEKQEFGWFEEWKRLE